MWNAERGMRNGQRGRAEPGGRPFHIPHSPFHIPRSSFGLPPVLRSPPSKCPSRRTISSSAAASPGSRSRSTRRRTATSCIVTKRARDESNTKYAQGGIAAVLSRGRLASRRTSPTRSSAGAGLCHERVVEICASRGPGAHRELIERRRALRPRRGRRQRRRRPRSAPRGRPLARAASSHAADMTGREVERALLDAVRGAARTSASSRTTWRSISSRSRKFGGPEVCAGAYVLDDASAAQVEARVPRARATVLATRRRRQGLPLHDEPRRRDRRRRRDGVPRGRRDREHGVLPVPPDVPLSPAGARASCISEALRGEGAVLAPARRHARS